jgi:hypothetical protein
MPGLQVPVLQYVHARFRYYVTVPVLVHVHFIVTSFYAMFMFFCHIYVINDH